MPRHAASATGPVVGGRSSASHGANVARRPSLAAPAACRSSGAQRGEHPLLAQRVDGRELVVDEPLQRTLEPGTQHFRFAAQQAEPLIAPRQQRREQALELLEVVADVAQ